MVQKSQQKNGFRSFEGYLVKFYIFENGKIDIKIEAFTENWIRKFFFPKRYRNLGHILYIFSVDYEYNVVEVK